jgi:hypothetical protein
MSLVARVVLATLSPWAWAVSPILCKRLAGIFALWVRSKRVAA